MKKWEDFENEVAKYLKDMLNDYNVIVKQYGSANSKIPDIEVNINTNNKKFYIETKMPTSQTSQFVVEIKNNKFIYGRKNKFKENEYSKEILSILNKNYKIYSKVNQSEMIVPVSSTIAFNWIVTNMKNKNVKFITSIDNLGNKIVFSIEQLNKLFNIKTIFRRKKSGSKDLPKKFYNDFKSHLDLKFSKYNYTLKKNGKKLFLELPLNLPKKECYINSNILKDGEKYFLSNKGNGIYEIKITSLINNPNIIFKLSLKDNTDFDMFTIQCLIDYINNNM